MNIIIIALFFIVALIILFFGNYYVLSVLLKTYLISGSGKTILTFIFAFFGSGFIAAMIILHYWNGIIVKAYYYVSGIWMGIVFYLACLLILLRIISILVSNQKYTSKPLLAVTTSVILALLIVIYGAWNAYNVKINNVEITLKNKNIPTNWLNKKIVQISDLHLGPVFKDKFLQNNVAKINKLNPDIVFITGDLFDGEKENWDKCIKALNGLNAKQGIYFITGNHENYFGLEKASEIISQTGIIQLKNEMAILDGMQIIGLNYPKEGESANIETVITNLPGYDRNKPSILLWHAPVQLEQANNSGISLILAGHTHRGQLFPFNLVSKLIFKGNDYGVHDYRGTALYTTSGLGLWGPTLRIATKPEIAVISIKN